MKCIFLYLFLLVKCVEFIMAVKRTPLLTKLGHLLYGPYYFTNDTSDSSSDSDTQRQELDNILRFHMLFNSGHNYSTSNQVNYWITRLASNWTPAPNYSHRDPIYLEDILTGHFNRPIYDPPPDSPDTVHNKDLPGFLTTHTQSEENADTVIHVTHSVEKSDDTVTTQTTITGHSKEVVDDIATTTHDKEIFDDMFTQYKEETESLSPVIQSKEVTEAITTSTMSKEVADKEDKENKEDTASDITSTQNKTVFSVISSIHTKNVSTFIVSKDKEMISDDLSIVGETKKDSNSSVTDGDNKMISYVSVHEEEMNSTNTSVLFSTSDNHYWTKGLLRLLDTISTKEPNDMKQIMKHMKIIIVGMSVNNKLDWLGQPISSVLTDVATLVSASFPIELRRYATTLKETLADRRRNISPELNQILDKTDNLVPVPAGEHLLETVDQLKEYPKIKKTGEDLCQEVIEAFEMPFHLRGADQQRIQLVKETNHLIVHQFPRLASMLNKFVRMRKHQLPGDSFESNNTKYFSRGDIYSDVTNSMSHNNKRKYFKQMYAATRHNNIKVRKDLIKGYNNIIRAKALQKFKLERNIKNNTRLTNYYQKRFSIMTQTTNHDTVIRSKPTTRITRTTNFYAVPITIRKTRLKIKFPRKHPKLNKSKTSTLPPITPKRMIINNVTKVKILLNIVNNNLTKIKILRNIVKHNLSKVRKNKTVKNNTPHKIVSSSSYSDEDAENVLQKNLMHYTLKRKNNGNAKSLNVSVKKLRKEMKRKPRKQA